MGDIFSNQELGTHIIKHSKLPIFEANAFDFLDTYHFKIGNRYSNIFPEQKVSYWSDFPQTARDEYLHWYKTKNYITFWAYDDGSGSIPAVYPPEPLYIIDGRKTGFNKIIVKPNNGIKLNLREQEMVDLIAMNILTILRMNQSREKVK